MLSKEKMEDSWQMILSKKKMENIDVEAECLNTTPIPTVTCPSQTDSECYLSLIAAPDMIYSVYSYSNQMGDVYGGIIKNNETVKLLPKLFLTSVTIEPYVSTPHFGCANHQISIGKSKFIIDDNIVKTDYIPSDY